MLSMLASASAVTPSEKSSVNTNRKSTTRFSMSLRWSAYVASKPPKGGSKTQNGRFLSKTPFAGRKSATVEDRPIVFVTRFQSSTFGHNYNPPCSAVSLRQVSYLFFMINTACVLLLPTLAKWVLLQCLNRNEILSIHCCVWRSAI